MIKKEIYPVMGMSCAACATRVDKALNGQEGVKEAFVNYASATAQVTFDDEVCTPSILKAVVQHAGYDLWVDADSEGADEVDKARLARYESLKKRTLWAIA